jgi:hypothetical protein
VPYFAAIAAGAGASAAARARFPRAADYETIDARAAAGVYAVAGLPVAGGSSSVDTAVAMARAGAYTRPHLSST